MLNIDIPNIEELELVVLDSDGVCIPRGTSIMESEAHGRYDISISTSTITPELRDKINELTQYVPVMISSGRALLYLQVMYRGVVGVDLMAENGSLVMSPNGYILTLLTTPPDYRTMMGRIRDDISLLPILGFEPKQYILTVHSEEEYPEVYDIVGRYDDGGILQVMWNGEAFDIQPIVVSKGEGLRAYTEITGVEMGKILGIGDRVNDRALLDVVGIPVSADISELDAPYYTMGSGLPGEILVDYLLEYYQGGRDV